MYRGVYTFRNFVKRLDSGDINAMDTRDFNVLFDNMPNIYEKL